MSSLSQDQIFVKMTELCALSAQADLIKKELGEFLIEGDSFSCPDGRLTKSKAPTLTRWSKEAETKIDNLKQDLLDAGMGTQTQGNPSLRLTLNKGGA